MKFRKECQQQAPNASFPGYASLVAISNGAFATVYRAVELGTSRPVALKVLRLGDASEPALEPLNEQLETLTLLSKHPNVVTLYRTFFTPEGHPVLVTELCRESLAQHLRRGGPLPASTVVPLGVKVAGALETAHQAGLVHGDIKPENILISAVGEPLVGDFGLARLQAAAEPTEHLAGESTLHSAPEAFEGGALSPAADVYGLASSMYQLLLGRGPFVTFPGESPASVILRLLRDPAPRPPLGSMPIALADLLEASLAKEPGLRPRSAASFAEALRVIEEASGWPKTPYVVWQPEELTGAPPALRPASVKGALEAGEGPSEAVDEFVETLGEDDLGSGEGKPAWFVEGPGGAGGAAPADGGAGGAALIEARWQPAGTVGTVSDTEVADGEPVGEKSAPEEPGEVVDKVDDGEGGDDGKGGEPVGAGAGEQRAERGAAGEGASGHRPTPESRPDGAAAGEPDPDGEATASAEGEEPPPSGSSGPGASPPVTRQVIMPPAVERTVVVPQALPPRLSDTSQPAHAIQSRRRSSGIPRQAG